MRLFIVFTILRKELLETLRDRRTLMSLLLLPLFVYPLFAIGVGKFQRSEMEAQRARASKVAVWGNAPEELQKTLESAAKLSLERRVGAKEELLTEIEQGTIKAPAVPDFDADPPDYDEDEPAWSEPEGPVIAAARGALARREVDAVLVFWSGFDDALGKGEMGRVSVYYDSVRDESLLAKDRLDEALRYARAKIVGEREKARALPRGFARAIEVLPSNVAPKARKIGKFLGSVLPMLLVFMALLGGFLPAIDLTAGEKERGTMQTLLCAPLLPIEIIAGKFLAVFCVSLLTALANIVSLAFTIRRLIPGELSLSIPTSIYALSLLLLLPITFLFSALFLAIAVFARDFKDGQNILTPVYLVVSLLTFSVMLPGVELNAWTALVPVLNSALFIKALFLGEARGELGFLALGSSCLYAALSLVLAARVFEHENVLLGGKARARTLLGLTRQKGETPGVGFALTVFALTLVLFFYGSLLLDRFGVLVQTLSIQYAFFLVPTVGLTLLFGFSAPRTLALERPSVRSVLGAVLLGASAWAIVASSVLKLLPPPEELAKELEKALLLEGQPLGLRLFVFALTPAICEELLFRGLVFSGLRRLGPVPAIVGSALLFGLAHGSLYRLLPTASLGLIMGFVRERTGSIAPSMVIHALNNGIAIVLLSTRPAWAEGLMDGAVPTWMLGGFAGIFALGLALVFAHRDRSSASDRAN